MMSSKNILELFMDINLVNKLMIYKISMILLCIIYCSTNAQIVHRRRITTSAQSTVCPGCAGANISPEAFRKIKIEMIKAQILIKLRMRRPPNITKPIAKLPPELLRQLKHRNRSEKFTTEENRAKTMEMIFFPEFDTNCHSRKPSSCLTFNFKNVPRNTALRSAELWVYKTRDPNDVNGIQTFTVTPRNHTTVERFHKKLAVIQTNITSGWIQFPLRHSVNTWWTHHRQTDPNSFQKLIHVTCKSCSADPRTSPISGQGEYRPFLMVHLKSDRRHRTKRSYLDCVTGLKSCCRERIRFSFKEIGWDWVAQPEYYDGYYCKGSCTDSTNLLYKHTLVIQLLARPGITPCCTPSKLLPMSILHYTKGGSYKFDNLDNMMVEKCGCA